MEKKWIHRALKLFNQSIYPTPAELNEIDWKLTLSDDKKKGA
jgi:hypothetical protein